MQNVGPADMVENEAPPSQDAVNIMKQLNAHKEDLVRAMKEFNSVLNDSTLKENKSVKQIQHEQGLVNSLAQSAASVNNFSPGEGSIGLCVFALRQTLSLRDAGNTLAYQIQKLSNKIDSLGHVDSEEEIKQKKEQLKALISDLNLDIVIDED